MAINEEDRLRRELDAALGALTNSGNVCRDLNARLAYLLMGNSIAPWLRKEIKLAYDAYGKEQP